MARKLILLCDGTGNQIEDNISNVLKFFRVLVKNEDQVVFYHPGVGTIGQQNPWARFRQKGQAIFGLATGKGLGDNILQAYGFLIDHYREGDEVCLFGFSRGAYTARAVAGMLRLIGLLRPEQKNLMGPALTAYMQASTSPDLSAAWHFSRIAAARGVPVRFLGVWDTVNSVIVPRPDRVLFWPTFQNLPYTRGSSGVEVFRQAMAIDERRCMFRLYGWDENQVYKRTPFVKGEQAQDAKQVWFAGVHSDIGGGYPEKESGLSKYPLLWMIEEAKAQGIKVQTRMVNHLVWGREHKNSSHSYAPPNAAGEIHNSLTGFWRAMEYYPKRASLKEWADRKVLLGRYLPCAEPRLIPEDAVIHESVQKRLALLPDYKPPNLPKAYRVEPETPQPA